MKAGGARDGHPKCDPLDSGRNPTAPISAAPVAVDCADARRRTVDGADGEGPTYTIVRQRWRVGLDGKATRLK
jgi:hypothetical protein